MKYRLSEELGRVDPAFIEEVFEYQEKADFKRRSMTIKKTVGYALTAAAAAAICVITAGAFGGVGMNKAGLKGLESYAGSRSIQNNLPAILTNVDIETAGESLADFENPEPGEAEILAVYAGSRSLWGSFALNINQPDKNLPDSENIDINWNGFCVYDAGEFPAQKSGLAGITEEPELVSSDGGILTFAFHETAILGLPDVLGICCDGYSVNGEFIGDGFDLTVPMESYKEPQTVICKEPKEIGGVQFELALDGGGMLLSGISPDPELLKSIYNDYDLKFRLRDGTEIVEHGNSFNSSSPGGEEYFSPDGVRLLGGRGVYENRIYCAWTAIIDVSQIESVTVGETEFTF